MQKRTYTVEKAAYLLGVEPERLNDLIRQNLIDTEEEAGELRIPKREIARLYHWISEDRAGEREGAGARQAQDKATPEAADASALTCGPAEEHAPERVCVEDEELLGIYGEMRKYQDRMQNLGGKIQRLASRVNRLKAMAAGENAKFWERASALYPSVAAGAPVGVAEEQGALYLVRNAEADGDDFKRRFRDLVVEGIQKGQLPAGFLGIFPNQANGDGSSGDAPEDEDN